MELPEKRVKKLMEDFDTSGDGALQLDEFKGVEQFRNRLEALAFEEKRAAQEAQKAAAMEKAQAELESLGETLRANPRNHTAGGIRQFKNPEKTKRMRLSFMAYGIENLANPDDPDNGGATVTPDGTGDPTHFDNPVKIREACEALVDHLDLLLCAGTLKADYGDSADPNNPRDVIIDFLAANSSWRDNDHNIESQQRVRHERYEKAAYLISISPQSMIQR